MRQIRDQAYRDLFRQEDHEAIDEFTSSLCKICGRKFEECARALAEYEIECHEKSIYRYSMEKDLENDPIVGENQFRQISKRNEPIIDVLTEQLKAANAKADSSTEECESQAVNWMRIAAGFKIMLDRKLDEEEERKAELDIDRSTGN